MSELNGYSLMRDLFDFAYENPEKISPNHIAMFAFIVEHCNRLGWKKKFGLPTEMTKEAIGIRNYKTFANTFHDLIDWGFIVLLEKSKNQYSANVIALVKNTKATTKALTKASLKHGAKQVQSIVDIDKPINNETNQTNETEVKEKFTQYMKNYLGTKGKSYDLLFEEFKKSCKKLGSSVDVEVEKIPAAIQAYKANVDKQRAEGFKDLKYKNASTWLNNQCWLEEYEEVKKQIIEC